MFQLYLIVAAAAVATPPNARIAPQVTIEHGITRVDPYAWMRDRDSDEIIVLEAGVIVERGTHAALWQQGQHYAALLQASEGAGESAGEVGNL